MTDAPEKIWAYAGSFQMWRDHKTDRGQRQTEYTRTDVTDARIDVIDWRKMFLAVHDRMQKSGESKEMGARWFSEAARAALKGEKT
tara:strand:- start:884 stop:1141 length:258 start_codon:yes stop_codon:yes gene_type:complete